MKESYIQLRIELYNSKIFFWATFSVFLFGFLTAFIGPLTEVFKKDHTIGNIFLEYISYLFLIPCIFGCMALLRNYQKHDLIEEFLEKK